MKEEKLKEAFQKIKEDMLSFSDELSLARKELAHLAHIIKELDDDVVMLKLSSMANNYEKSKKTDSTDRQTDQQTDKPTHNLAYSQIPTHNPTNNLQNPTHSAIPTHNPTHPQEIGGWNTQNTSFPTGNDGVPTDRQTNQQTNQHIIFTRESPLLGSTRTHQQVQNTNNVVTNHANETDYSNSNGANSSNNGSFDSSKELSSVDEERQFLSGKPIKQHISDASEILESLDNIKKEIRKKFKSITKQEMVVFSTIYTLEEQRAEVDYSLVAAKLGLSQSSIRDYVQKIMNKGIPIEKEKLNNKKILLHISPELKKLASLDTILRLREI